MRTNDVDGFEYLPAIADGAVELNVEYRRNEFSPYSRVESCTESDAATSVVDHYFGQSYSLFEGESPAIYGDTGLLPDAPVDSLATDGYLRVPFRKIPRIAVSSTEQILDVLGRFSLERGSERHLLFRGQAREHYLQRSPASREFLYGDSEALEPSLLPSAARASVDWDDILPQWSAFVQLFPSHRVAGAGLPDSQLGELLESFALLRTRFALQFFLLGLAQHYGLPSPGLDVTDRLEVGLFFALHRFVQKAPGMQTAERVAVGDRAHRPVLYVFAPHVRFAFQWQRTRPNGFPLGRPDSQSAWFLHVGWGLHQNYCARHVMLAFYLDPSGQFERVPTTPELFPDPDSDLFAEFLVSGRRPGLSPELDALLARFSWVKAV